ncbi:conserved hypothetical protein [Streptomyces clavuligerus]|nr:conserved hypothetical protein [Streptomyces clavuligerus]
MTQHPDVSEISDLTEGLLSPSRSVALRQHLDICELCADVRASLEEIRGLLGTLPGASRMPADIAERIDAALAAEALLASTSPGGSGAHVSRETSTVVPVLEPRPTVDRPLGKGQGTNGPDRGTTGPGRTVRFRRRRRAIGAVLAVAAAGMSVLLVQSFSSPDEVKPPSARGESIDTPVAGSQEFSDERLEEQARALAADHEGHTRDSSGRSTDFGALDEGGAPQLKHLPTAPPCVQKATDRADSPLGVDTGTYRGAAAFLLVFRDGGDSARIEAFVISADCVGSTRSSTGKVLFQRDYPRH